MNLEFHKTSTHPPEHQCPNHAGRMDDCSVDVLVVYEDEKNRLHYGVGYTDWDGDEFFWNIPTYIHKVHQVLAFAYLPDNPVY